MREARDHDPCHDDHFEIQGDWVAEDRYDQLVDLTEFFHLLFTLRMFFFGVIRNLFANVICDDNDLYHEDTDDCRYQCGIVHILTAITKGTANKRYRRM